MKITKVVAFGSFDILHIGHKAYLESAKRLGGHLTVVVARDSSIRKIKGREPVFDENARRELVASLKPVDIAVLGHAGDMFEILKEIKPDVIALGYDQKVDEALLRKKLGELGISSKIVRIREEIDSEKFKSSVALKKLQEAISEAG